MRVIIILSLVMLTACTETWSETGRDGMKLSPAMLECQAKARRSVDHQFRFHQNESYLPGTNDSRRNIERRETAMCLQTKGFKLDRSFR